MKKINNYVIEKLHISKGMETSGKFDADDTKVLNKLEYSLKRIFGDTITMSEDHQGSSKFYKLNHVGGTYSARRFIMYCKKIPEFNIKEGERILVGSYTKIGNDNIWVNVLFGRVFEDIRVSKSFYDSKIFPYE